MRRPLPALDQVSPRARSRNGARRAGGKKRLMGLALTATDTDFSIGDRPLVKGPTLALLLAASGRSALLDELSGPGASQLIDRVLQA